MFTGFICIQIMSEIQLLGAVTLLNQYILAF